MVLGGLAAVAAASAAALVAGLLTWQPRPVETARTPTIAEAERLAAVRVTNYRDGRARLRATLGRAAERIEILGWVDWTRPLVYLDVGGPGAGSARGLVQATPTLMAIRPDPNAVPTPAVPPPVPPTDDWRIRHRSDDHPTLSALLYLLFALHADRSDPVDPLRSTAWWVATDTVAGVPADVFRTNSRLPASAPTASTPTPSTGDDGWRYWVGSDARLHRLTGQLPGGTPVSLELDRSHRPPLYPVAVLGGAPGLPRKPTGEEIDRLTRMPARVRAVGGAALTLAVPTDTGANLRGGGWLDWSGQVAYLATTDLDAPPLRTLARYDRTGVTRAPVPAGDEAPDARPPLPPPADVAWQRSPIGKGELDRLVSWALRASRDRPPAGQAIWLRRDSIGVRQVDVIEVTAGTQTLRYWLDRAGVPRRLELRTPVGAWAQLDLVQAPVPRLPPVPTTQPAR